jgi:predicted metal-dependent HD superfamily phosphohydrolase
MQDSLIVKKVENYVIELFIKKSVAENLYHSISHTKEVVDIAEKIGKAEQLSSADMEIILIASWFHDTGHFQCCHGHEDQSSEYARMYLDSESYPEASIEKIIGCIKATRIPQQPKNKLEEIVCDADLHHLGQIDIEEKGKILRKEFELRGIKTLSDIDWLKTSIEFFKNHKFFTAYAIREFGTQKHINQLKLEKRLEKLKKHGGN